MNKIIKSFGSIALLCCSMTLRADIFGSDENSFQIEFVTIGNPGNPADFAGNPSPAGQVDYVYRMSKYEISEQMITKANALGNLGITKDTRTPDRPATSITWFEAAKFVNWLNTSAGGSPAYQFDGSGDFQLWEPTDVGFNPSNPFRNMQARYFLPSADEWYKAAYYDPINNIYFNYPTGSDTPPTAVISGTAANTAVYSERGVRKPPANVMQSGGASPFGTIGQGGNVLEWEETTFDLLNSAPLSPRSFRGGAFSLGLTYLQSSDRGSITGPIEPTREGGALGFRVASIPEPSTLAFAVVGSFSLLCRRHLEIFAHSERYASA